MEDLENNQEPNPIQKQPENEKSTGIDLREPDPERFIIEGGKVKQLSNIEKDDITFNISNQGPSKKSWNDASKSNDGSDFVEPINVKTSKSEKEAFDNVYKGNATKRTRRGGKRITPVKT